jgi:hypothetical protein
VSFAVLALQWSARIGDPTVIGWLTVVAYFVAAWLALRAFMVEKAGPPRPYRHAISALFRVMRKHWPRPPAPARRAALWLSIALALAFLGINKQLDLQTLVAEIGRSMALEQGWYEKRRAVQVGFIIAVLVTCAGGVAALAWLVRGHLADFWLPLGGMLLLAGFVAIRATSFHHMDTLISSDILGIRVNWILELGGIGLVAFAAMRRVRRARSQPAAKP